MGLDTNYLYLPDSDGADDSKSYDNKQPLKSTTVSTQYEQMTLSPSVVQITMDYLYVRKQLLDDGADVQTDMGQDVVLSIVCDAYNHEAMKRRVQFIRVDDNCNNG